MWLPLLRFNKYVCKSVLPLLRLNKSVCKSWHATSFFVDRPTTTTTTSSSSSKFGSFIIQTSEPSVVYGYDQDIKMFMLSSGSADGTGEDEDDDQIQKKKMVFKLDEDLDFSAFYKDFKLQGSLRMVGSCNGIICLHDQNVLDHSKGCTAHHYLHMRDVCLWNPATRQFRILPKSIPIQENNDDDRWWGEQCDCVVFGFDVKTKDYKVLRLTPLYDDDDDDGYMCAAQVYSLSTDSWRLLEEDIVVPNQGRSFISERYPKSKPLHSVLLSFDFTREIFTTSIQLPDPDNNNNCSSSIYKLVLSYLGQKWAAAFTTPRIHSSSTSVLNYLDDDKTEGTILSINGEFALVSTERNELQLFNFVTKEAIKDFTFGKRAAVCTAYAYEESLVSIMSGGNDDVLLRWQLPTHGTTYKLNLDAPLIYSGYTFGIGLCLTSDTGGCIGVRSLKAFGVRDTTQGEALAMLEAIKWAKKLELSPIIIESDSKNVVSFFMDDDDNNSTYWSSEALTLLREAKLLLNSSELDISFQYCSRSRNYVADIAAKLAREGLGRSCKEWTANSPGEIVMSLSKDLGIEI